MNYWKIEHLSENDGVTYVDGKEVTYKTGYQVATNGVECKTPEDAIEACRAYNGNAGVWFSGGVYYVDHSHHIKTKKKAVRIGKACKQISILRWNDMSLIYLKKST